MDQRRQKDSLDGPYQPHGKDTCYREGHDLFTAALCGTSQTGEIVYLLCCCGQQRRISRADWEQVEAKRASRAQTHAAKETRP